MIRRRRLSPVWNSIQIQDPKSKIQGTCLVGRVENFQPYLVFGVVNYDQRKTWSPLSSTADALSPGQLFQSPQILILQQQNQNRVNLGNKCIFFGIEYLILQKFIWRNIAFYFPAFFNRLTRSDLFRSGPFSDIWAKPIPIDEVTSTIGHG